MVKPDFLRGRRHILVYRSWNLEKDFILAASVMLLTDAFSFYLGMKFKAIRYQIVFSDAAWCQKSLLRLILLRLPYKKACCV